MFKNLQNLIQSHKQTKNYVSSKTFNNIEFGCSFDPFHQIFFETEIKPLDSLKYIHNELKIKNIRLSIRWDKVIVNGKFDFSAYEKLFDYCFANDFQIVLNIGPIKVMRWPEEHIPKEFKNLVKNRENITLQSPITDPALSYLKEILKFIKIQYSKGLDKIIAIQGDNECFNRFGQFGVFVAPEFEKEVIKIIKSEFPNKTIFMNSAGLNDFKHIFETVKDIKGEYILGLNYYYKTPIQHKTFLLKHGDSISINKPFSISPEKLKKIAELNNYKIEISELQGEPWWPDLLSPGSDFKEFIFTIHRSVYLKPDSQKKLLIRYWGIEDFVSKILLGVENEENIRIASLIKNLNSN